VDPAREVGTLAEYYCNYGYESDNDPLMVECEHSLFWNSSALNCSQSQKICAGVYVTKVCYNCGGVDETLNVVYANTSETECKNHIINNGQTSATYNRLENKCYVFHSEADEVIEFTEDIMHMRKSCNEGKIMYLIVNIY